MTTPKLCHYFVSNATSISHTHTRTGKKENTNNQSFCKP